MIVIQVPKGELDRLLGFDPDLIDEWLEMEPWNLKEGGFWMRRDQTTIMLEHPIHYAGHTFPANVPIGIGRVFYSLSDSMEGELDALREYVLVQGVVLVLPPEDVEPFDPRNN
jgi:hypothetical protein